MEPLHTLPNDPQPDWARLLPQEAFTEIILVLRAGLPSQLTEPPAELERRTRAAMAAVGALLPATAFEGRLAAQAVVADAWAMDCLRLARERQLELEVARRCQLQAASMMREGKSALRALEKLQAARRKREADDVAANQAAWVEHSALGMMAAALSAAAGAPAPAAPAPAEPAGEPVPDEAVPDVSVLAAARPSGAGKEAREETKRAAAEARLVKTVSKYDLKSLDAGFETRVRFPAGLAASLAGGAGITPRPARP